MVNTSSNSKKENNRVTITNNQSKYYSDLAQTYANQAKNYSEIAETAQEAISALVDADDLSTIADNIEDIQEIAENLESLTAATVWGDIGGTLSSQVDLKEALDAKADTADLSEVATSGSYNDLTDKPTIPDISNLATKTEVQAKADTADLSEVATSGSYNDLTDKPTIPSQYTLPTASTTTLGGVKVDGSSITISNGVISASVSEGTMDYSALTNKPKINNVELSGNKTLSDLGIQAAGNYLTSIPSEYVTETELNNKNYLTNSDLTGYALKSEIPTVPQNITTQGNSFNNANQLVKLDSSGKLPAIDGSQLTNISSGSSVVSTFPSTITHTNGQFTVELGKNYTGEVDSTSITIVIDEPADYSKLPYPYSTFIQLYISVADATITFKTSGGKTIDRYFNNTTPDVSELGTYNITIEQYGVDTNLESYTTSIGVVYTGDAPVSQDGSGGGPGGGFEPWY